METLNIRRVKKKDWWADSTNHETTKKNPNQSSALHLALATTRNLVYIFETKLNKHKYSEPLTEIGKGLRSGILMCLPDITALRTAILSNSGEQMFN